LIQGDSIYLLTLYIIVNTYTITFVESTSIVHTEFSCVPWILIFFNLRRHTIS